MTQTRTYHSWIELPLEREVDRLVHRRGVTSQPGLHFLGMPWQHTRGSALIGWVGDDASFLVDRIAERAGSPAHLGMELAA